MARDLATGNRTLFLIKRIKALSRMMRPKPTGVSPLIKPLKNIKAVLFDVYGTMLISGAGDIGAHAAANQAHDLRKALRAVGLAVADPRQCANRAITLMEQTIALEHARRRRAGMVCPEINIIAVWRNILGSLKKQKLIYGTLTPNTVRRLAVEYECRINPVWPMPGLRDILPRLRQNGLRMGIISNAQFFTPLILDAFPATGWQQGLFQKSLCAWSYRQGTAKPSPHMLATLLAKLSAKHGITPPEVLCIGNDMRNDILPAHQAGCQTALFAGDARSLRWRRDDPDCAGLQPTLILANLKQLLRAVQKSG